MVESVGKKLEQARKRQQITVEEAARATRMRPDKIADLERDNFTNFPNMTYAKGFLVIYAKFLNVDVSSFAETLATTNPVGIEDYEYLNASERRQPNAAYRAPRPALWPFFMGLVILAVAVCVMYFVLTLNRISAPEPIDKVSDAATPASATTPGASPQATVGLRATEPAVAPLPVATPEVPAATPVPVPSSSPTPTPAPAPKEVILKPLKKTWVRVVQNVADSPPVFEDWLYPDARALKFRGAKFWIEVRDKDAVQITKDGQAVPISSSPVIIE